MLQTIANCITMTTGISCHFITSNYEKKIGLASQTSNDRRYQDLTNHDATAEAARTTGWQAAHSSGKRHKLQLTRLATRPRS